MIKFTFLKCRTQKKNESDDLELYFTTKTIHYRNIPFLFCLFILYYFIFYFPSQSIFNQGFFISRINGGRVY